jgi:hypothetical protein
MSFESGKTPPLVGTLDYLAEVAKDWARHRFATAQRHDFTLSPHRFELQSAGVRRHRIPPASPEACSPLATASRPTRPTAWCRCETVTLLMDSDSGTVAVEQEIVEVLAVDGDELLAEAAVVARIPGCPPCLGRFWSAA